MQAGHRHPAGCAVRPARWRDDSGTSLIELLVAAAVIATVMTSLTSFFVMAVSVTSRQSGQQSAVQLAADAMAKVRALRGSAVIAGRDRTSSNTQWATPATGVAPYLADSQQAWDGTASYPAGLTAPLPTAPHTVTVDGVGYQQHWYVGRCWQQSTSGTCGPAQTAGTVPMYRVVVAVTWPEQHCPGGICSRVTSTLVSSATTDPLFARWPITPPAVTAPGDQVGEVSVPATLQLTATSGTAPLTWSCFGLPTGLSADSSGLVSGTPTVAGSYVVTARTLDAQRQVGTATFTWTVHALPALTGPGNQTTVLGTPVSLTPTLTGGTAPMTWSVAAPGAWGATGLPPGLTINTSTGTISGTPTTTGAAKAVTVTVTDRYGKQASTTFTWAVQAPAAPLTVQSPGFQLWISGWPFSLQVRASGGVTPYRWTWTSLPTGLSVTSGGVITGTPTDTGIWLSTVTVTDATGAQAGTGVFVWWIL